MFLMLYYQNIKNYANLDQKLWYFFVSMFLAVTTSLIVGTLTGAGGEIQGRGANFQGNKGFFIGANEVGIILCILTTIMYMVYRNNRKLLLLGAALVIMVCGIIVFTKSSLIASLLAVLFLWIKIHYLRPITIITIVSVIVYLRDNITLFWNFIEGSFFNTLFQNPISFLFRGRQHYIDAFMTNVQVYEHPVNSVVQVFFGNGDWQTVQWISSGLGINSPFRTSFEMDFFDVLSALGLIGFSCYVFFASKLFNVLGRSSFCNNNKAIKLGILAIIAHSFIAGHVIFSIQITLLLTILYAFSKAKLEQEASY